MKTRRMDAWRIELLKEPPMKVAPLLFVSRRLVVEESALAQLAHAAAVEDVVSVYGMPDIHTGYGVPIGSVVVTRSSISPAAVGYDINCGMRLVATPFHVGGLDVVELAEQLARDIPLGEGRCNISLGADLYEAVLQGGLRAYLERRPGDDEGDLARVEYEGSLEGDVHALPPRALERGADQFATLGGGNHFIEIQRVSAVLDADEAGRLGLEPDMLTVMIHSGSRGLGHETGGRYMKLARTLDGRSPGGVAVLPLSSSEGKRYLAAMNAAANFAYVNRHLMTVLVRRRIRRICGREVELPLVRDVSHNIARIERLPGVGEVVVHRKGATASRPGGLLIIPGSMGTASYLLKGSEGASKSAWSVSHGAGRVMSRTAAAGRRRGRRRRGGGGLITEDMFRRSMEGIHLVCRDRRAVFEEAPAAYKDIDEVVRVLVECDLARPVVRLEPLAVLKG